jgi:hypothetical protein
VNFSTTIVQSGAAAGTFYYNIVFKNTSDHDVTIEGYPLVYLIPTDGSAMGPANKNPVQSVTRLVLKPGEKAYSLLGIPDSGNFPDTPVEPVTWLLVIVPGHDPAVAKFASPISVTTATRGYPSVSAVSPTIV